MNHLQVFFWREGLNKQMDMVTERTTLQSSRPIVRRSIVSTLYLYFVIQQDERDYEKLCGLKDRVYKIKQ